MLLGVFYITMAWVGTSALVGLALGPMLAFTMGDQPKK